MSFWGAFETQSNADSGSLKSLCSGMTLQETSFSISLKNRERKTYTRIEEKILGTNDVFKCLPPSQHFRSLRWP